LRKEKKGTDEQLRRAIEVLKNGDKAAQATTPDNSTNKAAITDHPLGTPQAHN